MGVPNLPGVPLLASFASSVIGDLLTSDGVGIYNDVSPAQWGIFLDGSPVVVADTVATFDYKREFAIADYPIEQGAFATYDKVQIPFDVRFRFTSGGSEANRAALINSAEAVAEDNTNLYTAVTPEQTYPSVTVSHISYNRNHVVGLVSVDLWCLNINVSSPSAMFQNTQSPSGASQVPDGTVQPQDTPTNGTTASPSFTSDTPSSFGTA